MMQFMPKKVRVNEEADPYLAPAPPPPLAGLAPDLLAILRRRRDRALERREAERGAPGRPRGSPRRRPATADGHRIDDLRRPGAPGRLLGRAGTEAASRGLPAPLLLYGARAAVHGSCTGARRRLPVQGLARARWAGGLTPRWHLAH